jgi:diguanylate cyclase (GGDEF)-like protein
MLRYVSRLSENIFIGTALVAVMVAGVALLLDLVYFALTGFGQVGPLEIVAMTISSTIILTPPFIYPWIKSHRQLLAIQAALERLARTDTLTDLPNRRGFFERVAATFARPGTAGTRAMMMVDVDRFKRINDNYGHDAGDAVLRLVARTIEKSVREAGGAGSFVGRVGGEEFAILVDGLDWQGALRLADRICSAVRETRLAHRGDTISATISLGVAFCEDGRGIDSVLKLADEAVYQAKRQGRDRWCANGVADEAESELAASLHEIAESARRHPKVA